MSNIIFHQLCSLLTHLLRNGLTRKIAVFLCVRLDWFGSDRIWSHEHDRLSKEVPVRVFTRKQLQKLCYWQVTIIFRSGKSHSSSNVDIHIQLNSRKISCYVKNPIGYIFRNNKTSLNIHLFILVQIGSGRIKVCAMIYFV